MDKGPYGRKDRLIQEKRHDTYREPGKWPEPTLCTECGALYINGRWTWKKTLQKTYPASCPACRRIADNYPAGYIEIKGPFFNEHRDEILNLTRNIETREKGEHPLERIISITEAENCTLETTTGIHLARRIGEALSRSYKGRLSYQYATADKSIRVSWQR